MYTPYTIVLSIYSILIIYKYESFINNLLKTILYSFLIDNTILFSNKFVYIEFLEVYSITEVVASELELYIQLFQMFFHFQY